MGASVWSYFVPYETNVDFALQALRQQVFERGEYYKISHDDWRNMIEEEMLASLSEPPNESLDKIMMNEWRKVKSLSEPTDISLLLAWNMESGTHSIIDMNKGVSEYPEFGTVSPLTQEQLLTLFGSLQPTHQVVADWLKTSEWSKIRSKWQGLYIVIYENGNPSEVCFAGFSGD